MINIFSLSIYIPNLFQFIALFLTGLNVFTIFLILDKHNMSKRIFFYIFIFFAAEVSFCFVWRLFVGNKIDDICELWQTLKIPDNMYDVITFNALFFIVIFTKYRPSFTLKKRGN